jgi:cell wall-associated NlpC family hydrolase
MGIVLTVLAGCATAPRVDGPDELAASSPQARQTAIGERAAATALRQIGVPYRYGGASPSGFDCSGLVQYSYGLAGRDLPRTTAALWRVAITVEEDSLRAGDLLFFRFDGKMSHVGLYVGNGRFVHAPSSGKVVTVDDLRSEPYSRAFVRSGRVY